MPRSLGERDDRNGYEAYRPILAAYEPKSAGRSMGLLQNVLHPTFSSDLFAWQENLLFWEQDVAGTPAQLARDCVSLC